MTDLTINPKFESLIPKLTDDEFRQLEENILKDGITEPLVVWNGVLVDGHNRYKLAKKHNLGFEIREVSFNSENDAEIWIIKNQFGRRNLSTYDRAVLALKLKPVIAEKAKENQGARNDICQKSDKCLDTKKELAKIAGMSHDTIHRVEVIETRGTDDLKQKVRSGEKSINEAYISVTPKKKTLKQETQEAKERHADFSASNNGENKMVSFRELKQDANDVEVIGRGFYIEIMDALKPIRTISFTKDGTDVDALVKTYGWEKKKRLAEMIDETIKRLRYLRKVLTETT